MWRLLRTKRCLFFALASVPLWMLLLLARQKEAPDGGLSQQHQRMRRRNLILHDPTHGTITLDYYRTYETKIFFFFFRWKKYSISKAGILTQLAGLNVWFDGRVKFVRGNVFDYDGPHENVDSVLELQSFADPASRNLGRISVLVVKTFDDATSGRAAQIDVPLGGKPLLAPEVAPALTIKADGTFAGILDNLRFGLAHLSGGILAHEIGHVLGFQHTGFPGSSGFSWPYAECGLDLRYPLFGEDDEFTHRGDVYFHDDWKGRTNLMTRFSFSDILNGVLALEIGMYKFNYEPVFDQITQCWFERSSLFTG